MLKPDFSNKQYSFVDTRTAWKGAIFLSEMNFSKRQYLSKFSNQNL